ncbi:hypothetical protein PHLGIDRAFT_442950 [Phlebiopsis gigantea 11061_1 CR5-6]|uniref:RRM domain-containing protein n=1 Tax=Phlebiopsis gigantea (strain 11061_1 CR5-6) TaxID=745531 RepID=A0A0C3SAB5_PHLG1|nr:hypothetical protein PHLGIDRAFT_442950 [Phlebiopsis gigantea 11061_1 CR5-6]
MYRLSRGVRFLRPTRLIQNSRRLTNNLGSVSAQVEVLTQNVTKDEQSEDVSLKKEGFPLHVADPLQRQRLSHAARAVRSLLVRVDYVPDGTTEEELRELLSKYGDVVRVRLGTSSAEQFFGRAYAMFSTGSELREALEKLRDETLTVRGAQLTVDVVQTPPNLTETIFVGNINSDNTSDEDLMTAFSKYGNIQALRRGDQGRYAHIVYDSPQAAELVINRTTIEPVSLHGNTLAAAPRTLCHCSRSRKIISKEYE